MEKQAKAITRELVFSLLPRRAAEAHKGDFGRLLIVAGSSRYRGAARLAADGALHCGAGIVTLASTEAVIQPAACALPELTFWPMPAAEDGSIALGNPALLAQAASGCTALAAGCGLTQSASARAVIEAVVSLPLPLVLDADGLNLIAAAPGVLAGRAAPTLLTPHPGEMARLCGRTVAEISAAREGYALWLASQTGCVVVLKGHRTLIAAPDGRCRVNTTGGPGLARGGSGDLLTGMAGALLAQRMDPFDAASCAVWLHGAAADACAARRGILSMQPHELLEDLGALLAAAGF